MSFSRKHRPYQQINVDHCNHGIGENNYVMDGGESWRWPMTYGYHVKGSAEVSAAMPPPKRRRNSSSFSSNWQQEGGWDLYCPRSGVVRQGVGDGPSTSSNLFSYPKRVIPTKLQNMTACTFPVPGNSDTVKLAVDEDPVFMSRDEIERCSPSRKDGIDVLRETRLRYSYCAFLQNLGMCLELPQTTIGTAMVLCHRFFLRRSHAYHDRFLIATAALFLAAKSEETPCPLDDVVKTSTNICYNETSFSYMLPVDCYKKYRELVIEAEQLILTTLDFELNVQHPYTHLISVLNKLGLSQPLLVNMAWNLINEGLRSSLWLQFKPHNIAAGAAFLAAQFLNFDLGSYQGVWLEFQTAPSILEDVGQQLLELL